MGCAGSKEPVDETRCKKCKCKHAFCQCKKKKGKGPVKPLISNPVEVIVGPEEDNLVHVSEKKEDFAPVVVEAESADPTVEVKEDGDTLTDLPSTTSKADETNNSSRPESAVKRYEQSLRLDSEAAPEMYDGLRMQKGPLKLNKKTAPPKEKRERKQRDKGNTPITETHEQRDTTPEGPPPLTTLLTTPPQVPKIPKVPKVPKVAQPSPPAENNSGADNNHTEDYKPKPSEESSTIQDDSTSKKKKTPAVSAADPFASIPMDREAKRKQQEPLQAPEAPKLPQVPKVPEPSTAVVDEKKEEELPAAVPETAAASTAATTTYTTATTPATTNEMGTANDPFAAFPVDRKITKRVKPLASTPTVNPTLTLDSGEEGDSNSHNNRNKDASDSGTESGHSEECQECMNVVAGDYGHVDESDGMFYCNDCWEKFEGGNDGTQTEPPMSPPADKEEPVFLEESPLSDSKEEEGQYITMEPEADDNTDVSKGKDEEDGGLADLQFLLDDTENTNKPFRSRTQTNTMGDLAFLMESDLFADVETDA